MDSAPRTYRFLPGDVYTSGYRIVGKIMVSTHGIMGIMNDITKSHLEIHDARLARIHMPTKLVDHFEVVRLIKAQVMAICAARREDLGPNNLQRSGLFAPINPAAFIEKITNSDNVPRFPDWRAINAQALVTGRITRQGDGRLKAEFRLWDVFAGQQLDGKQYFTTPDNWRRIAHKVTVALTASWPR